MVRGDHAKQYAHDNRQPHRQALRSPDRRRQRNPRGQAPRYQALARRLRPDVVRSGLQQHRLVQEQGQLHRRRQGHPALSRLPDRRAGRKEHLPGDRVSDRQGRAARLEAFPRLGAQRQDPHDGPREYQEVHGGLPLRRASDGDAGFDHRGAVDLLSGSVANQRPRVAPAADPPADRQAADARGLCLSPHARLAVRLSRQRAELHGQLPLDAVQDDGAEVQAQSGAGARARPAVHPARRPRAELLGQRDALGGQLAGRSVFGHRCRGRRALRAAPWRRERSRRSGC